MFSVGEIAVLVWMTGELEGNIKDYVGQDVEITGPPMQYNPYKYPFPMYSLRAADGQTLYASEGNLRKKPPYDGNVKTTWDDLIVWKPKEVVTV